MGAAPAARTPVVLVVDDDDDGRASLALYLRIEGFETWEAATGGDALHRAADRPDVILLDVVLPDLSGLEVCRRLRADPATLGIPIVMLSGLAVAPHDQASGLEGGADAYLTKPADPEVVAAYARGLLRAHRAEEQLRASEARFRAIIETSFDGVALLAADGTTLYSSPAAERIHGHPPDELAGRDGHDLLHPDDRERVRGFFAGLIGAPGAFAESVQRVRHRDGSYRWLEARATNLLHDPAVRAVVVNFRDITGRRAAEDESRLRDRALRAVTQGILITDSGRPDDPIVYASPGFEAISGYAAAEALGSNCRFLQGPGTDRAAVARLRHAIRAGEPVSVELLNYRKDGSPFWNELSLSPVRDAGGRVTHFVGVMADVSGRKSLEEQFRQAQKMEAVGRLAGGIAHDFNNLLTVINGYGEILLEQAEPGGPTAEMLTEIARAGERAAGLTRQLLAFSRQTVLAPRVLDINALLRNMARMLRRLLGEDVELELRLAPGLGRTRADPGQLEQAVVNLGVNARDAMPRGGRLTIETRNDGPDAPGNQVEISVSDTGHGMDEATLARVFEPFFTTKEPGRGTGLGLAMVFGFAQQSGGRVAAESRPGWGATFHLYLPRVPDSHPTENDAGAPAELPRGRETLLLVEDEPAVRAVALTVLRGCGYAVLEAGDGPAAVRVAGGQAGPIDLVMTDVVMPGGLGGRQVAEAVRATHPEAAVLFCSGYTDDAVVRHGVLEAGVPFLQKPFTPAELARKVREVLDARGAVR